MDQSQFQDINKEESKLSQVHLKISFNHQASDQEFQKLAEVLWLIKDKFIDLRFQQQQLENIELKSILILVYEPSKETYGWMKKLMSYFQHSDGQQLQIELEILVQRTNLVNLQTLHKTIEMILHHVNTFKFTCKSEINEKQLNQIIQLLKLLREVESFQFICEDKILFKEQDYSVQLVTEIQRITQNSKTLVFNNCQVKEKGYNSSEICPLPGLLSQSIAKSQQMENLEINFSKVGWIRRNRKNFTMHLQNWPTKLKVIKIDFDRLICFNTNYENIVINNFFSEFSNMLSKQTDLTELSLNLQGIGYQCGQSFQNYYPALCSLTQYIKNVRVLKLLLGGKIHLSQREWNTFFEGITKLNIESWKFFLLNLSNQEQYEIINTFLNDLIKNQKLNLQRFSLNIDNWLFLEQVDQLQLLKNLSQLEYLNDLQILHSKTKNLPKYSLIRQAEVYYYSLQIYTQIILINQNALEKSNILTIISDTLKKDYFESVQIVIKNLINQNLFVGDNGKIASLVQKTSDKIIRSIQSILDLHYSFQLDIQTCFYDVKFIEEIIEQILALPQKQTTIYQDLNVSYDSNDYGLNESNYLSPYQ